MFRLCKRILVNNLIFGLGYEEGIHKSNLNQKREMEIKLTKDENKNYC